MITYEEYTNDFGFKSIFKKDNGIVVLIIPENEDNSDYQAYLKWLENPDAEITPPTL